MEQRISLKFLVRLGKGPPKSLRLLHKAYEDVTSQPRVFEWYKCFTQAQEGMHVQIKDQNHANRMIRLQGSGPSYVRA